VTTVERQTSDRRDIQVLDAVVDSAAASGESSSRGVAQSVVAEEAGSGAVGH
jgi:hypothetical protein